MNQLDSDSHLPPRKRLLAGLKKQNANSNGSSSSSSSPCTAFASSSSNSNGSSSSSASADVQTRVDNLLSSSFNTDQNQSPEKLLEAARSAAALAVKVAKTARAMANEKALISAKAIATAKRALELVDSFPKEPIFVTAGCKEKSPKKNKQKKHVPLEHLYSKGQLRDEEDDLAHRLHRGIDNKLPRISRTYSGFEENSQQTNKKHKKNKTVVEGIATGSMNGIAGVVDSDSSFEGLESNRKEIKPDEADAKEKAEHENNSLVKRRGRVKLKKLPLNICESRNQEASSGTLLPVAQPGDDDVGRVAKPGSSSWKCQDLKAPECVKQNKAVRS